MTARTILAASASISLVWLAAACGGGGGSGDSPGGGSTGAGTPLPPVATPPAPSADCTTPTVSGGVFRQITDTLGLCYPVESRFLATETQVMGGGLAMSDVDRDGYVDLYVAHGIDDKGALFLGSADGFVRARGNNGISLDRVDIAGYFVDINADGWDDFVSILYTPNFVEVYLNDGTGQFEEATASTGIWLWKPTSSLAVADYDLDGDLDLFFGHWGVPWEENKAFTEYLWENNGTGFFSDVSEIVEIVPAYRPPPEDDARWEYSLTPLFADINSDGYPDMLLTSDFTGTQVLLNNAGESFSDITTEQITDENGMGSTVADYDFDGDLDWFVSSIHNTGEKHYVGGETGNRLYRNDGEGRFGDVTEDAGVREGAWGWGACFADFDNDGYVDLFHTNGWRSTTSVENDPTDPFHAYLDDPSRLFMANGDRTFTERSATLGINHREQGRGVVCTDFDDDGRIDLFIANNGRSPTVYRNEFDNANHYLQIELKGPAGNPASVGARVFVETARATQMQEVVLGSNYLSQQPCTLHFGLGEATRVASVTVRWPGAHGPETRIDDVAADQRLVVVSP